MKHQPAELFIVQQDETPDNAILGVFANYKDADDFAESIKENFPDHVIIEKYPIGYKYTDGGSRYADS